MKYKSDEYEPRNYTAIPAGDYTFTVVNSEERWSQKNNEMINLELAVDVGRENELTVYSRLVNTPKALFVIEQFCAAVGIDFRKDSLSADDCFGKTGKAHFALGQPKDDGKRYLEVKWYIKPEGYAEQPGPVSAAATQHAAEQVRSDNDPQADGDALPEDDIPF